MAMESNDNLTSYLKSMFVQLNGEQHSPVAASRSPISAASTESESMIVENHSAEVEDISSLKLQDTSSSDATETDINNNTNGRLTIEVDVDVHHSHNDLNDAISSEKPEEQSVGHQQSSPSQSSLAHNKIALTFLDELKQTLQVNERQEEQPPVTSVVAEVQFPAAEEPPSTPSSDESAPSSDLIAESNINEEVITETKSPIVNGTASPSGKASESSASSVHDDESVSANEEVSTTESGIQEDLDQDDQSSNASQSSPTIETAADTANRLNRSVSADSNSSTGSNGRRVILRSISQDVRFKLESIKEEKKVTKSHVSELANFWKGKMISPKDNH